MKARRGFVLALLVMLVGGALAAACSSSPAASTETTTEDDAAEQTAKVVATDPGEFVPSGDMKASRIQHSVVNLTDGRIMVIGGKDTGANHNSVIHASTEIYDQVTGEWD